MLLTNGTLLTTGMLPALVLLSAALTAPVSLLLLWRYRRAVIRAMAAQSGAEPPPQAPAKAAVLQAPSELHVATLDAATIDRAAAPLYRRIRRSLFAVAGIYVVAGLAYALVLASAWMVVSRAQGGVPLTRLIWLWACYAWPLVLAVCIVTSVSRAQRTAVVAAYFAVILAIAIYALMRNAELTAAQLGYFWLFANAPGTLLLLAFLQRRVRAVGPLVLAFTITAITGSQAIIVLVGASEFGVRVAADVGSALGLGGASTFVALMLVGMGVFAVAGWSLLKRIGRSYQRRAMSDQSLTLDAMWLLFGIVQSITLAFEGLAWVATGLVAFGVYKAVTLLGFKALAVAQSGPGSPTLLLLRVFALGRRSERLFDGVSKY